MNKILTLVICLVIFATACSENSSFNTAANVDGCDTSRLLSYNINPGSQNNLSKMAQSITVISEKGLDGSRLIEDLNCIKKNSSPANLKAILRK